MNENLGFLHSFGRPNKTSRYYYCSTHDSTASALCFSEAIKWSTLLFAQYNAVPSRRLRPARVHAGLFVYLFIYVLTLLLLYCSYTVVVYCRLLLLASLDYSEGVTTGSIDAKDRPKALKINK